MPEVASPSVLSVATAVPPYRIGQGDVKQFAVNMFGETHRDIGRLMPIFENVQVDNRHFCVPLSWFDEEHTFPEKNALYVENALNLSEKAASRALDKAGVEPSEVGAIFFVSTTGLATPSLDSKLIFRLGLPHNTRRYPSYGLGCAGGVSGLAMAANYVRVRPDRCVLLVAVELSGLTFQRGDSSKANLISTSLFADGAAAVVLGGSRGESGGRPRLVGDYNVTWPETEDVMGWDLISTGFKVKLSKSVPNIVREKLKDTLIAGCEGAGLDLKDLKHFVLHPGGAKVLDAFEEVLGLEPGGLTFSRGVLRDYGNMSSVTALFILERFLESGEYAAGEPGVISAMGPGFSAEHVFFRC